MWAKVIGSYKNGIYSSFEICPEMHATTKMANLANMAKMTILPESPTRHKAMRGPIKVGDTGEFGKYGENDNIATIANRAWKFTNGLIYNGC